MLSIILCVSFIATIISLQHDSHEVIETSRYAVQVTLNIFLYTLPFFAYMSVISAFMSSALGSLLISAVIYIFLLFLGHYLSLGFSLLPSGLKENLYAMNIQNAGQTIIGLLIYTLVYISLGWLIFRKRNL